MKEETKMDLARLGVIIMFVFVGLAVNANIIDAIEGTGVSFWFNVIGFCLVPIFLILGYSGYKKLEQG